MKRIIDFLNHNPVLRYAKNIRNEIVDQSFRSQGHKAAAALVEQLLSQRAENVCFTIAFNVPWVIEILIASWRRHPTGLKLAIINNSSIAEKRAQINDLCRRYDIPHVDLPSNPEWSPNRSHGIAMNWAFYNLVRSLRPKIFGFVDHDCFPITPIDIVGRMEDKDIYGVRRMSPKRHEIWNLWAGYCFYRLAAMDEHAIDFKHRIELGLDTGGGNWLGLYKSLDPSRLSFAPYRQLDREAPLFKELQIIIDNSFIHIGASSFRRSDQKHVSDRLWDNFLSGTANRTLDSF